MMTHLLTEHEISTTLTYATKVQWVNFYPFDLVIHNHLAAPLPFNSRAEFLKCLLDTWNHRTIERISLLSSLTLKEKLFETFMVRFEVFNSYKEYLHRLWQQNFGLTMDVETTFIWLQSFDHLMKNSIDNEKNIKVLAAAKIWLYYYHKVQSVWFKDDSTDLEMTMVTLDSQLNKFLDNFY